jgi:intein-encoded DNA endonuclease-like protein
VPIYKKVNQDFFKKWTHEMAYVLGFFAADGNIIETKRGTHFFSIQVTDKDIVYAIREAIGSEHAISERKPKGNEQYLYRLQIGSKEIYADLCTLGFSERKAKRLQMPKVPSKYLADFVRGYFDGDGNVWVGFMHKERKTKTLTMLTAVTSASHNFLADLQGVLSVTIGLTGSLHSRKEKECWCLTYSVRDSLKLYDFMYNRSVQGLFLPRKKKVFEKYIRMQS